MTTRAGAAAPDQCGGPGMASVMKPRSRRSRHEASYRVKRVAPAAPITTA
ncbi:hypothetical protein SBADM41S_06230 [Streptomyces badius]